MGSYRMCGCFTRKFKHFEVGPPLDVKEFFRVYAEGGNQLSVEQFYKFLVEVQGENASVSDAEKIVEQVLQKRHHLAKFTRHGLNLDDFYYYLFSSDLNPPITENVHQDMTKPLSHYFIFTGHNSYLTGNQLSSDCSDKPIIKALMRGVRAIELDLWPNSGRDDINVLHGRTLTTPVDFITCLKSIKEHAFKASPYPVIITLEDHLTADLQAKAAEVINEMFGKMLFVPECDCLEELPSPEDLKYRIIISTKPPKEYLTAQSAAQSVKEKGNSSRKNKDSDDDDAWGEEPPYLASDQEDGDMNGSETSEESDDDSFRNGVSAYKRLIAIHAGKPKGGFKEKLKVDPNKVRRLSLSEQKLEKAAENHGTDVIRFTQKNLLRVFPKGTRFNSSNYKPIVGWMHGAQMVAFNMQGYGKALWLMHGMFRSNGGCGYVRKPNLLMKIGGDGEVFNPKAKVHVKKTLKVKVYRGDGWHMDFKQTHFDNYSPPDFYTRVGIFGLKNDVVMKRTKTLEDNWMPVWDEEFTFPLTVPELALLRIEVRESDFEKDEFAGQTCLPVSELRSGVRSVPLFDRKGIQYKSVRLLLRIEFA